MPFSIKTKLTVSAALAALLLGSAGLTGNFTALAQDQSGASEALAVFSEYNDQSKAKIDHQILTSVLQESVFPLSPAVKRMGWKNKTIRGTGTNLSKSINSSPSRYEGNRLMIHAFSDAHKEFFQSYQAGLEALTERRALATFNKDEQLAYWLNLYNVIVMNKIIDEYPISNTKKLRKDKSSFWQEKAATVGGMALSLEDIENILTTNWDSPLVIYGLWQGSVGGPSLQREAFTGENVWKLLDRSAREFVNSNRGVIPKGDTLKVSDFYEWVKPAFGNSDAVLLSHIKAFARPDFMGDISGARAIDYDYYDWTIADLVGGDLSTGTKFAGSIRGDLNMSLVGNANGAFESFPEQAQNFFAEMMKEEIPIVTGPEPIVTSEECAPDEACEVGPDKQ